MDENAGCTIVLCVVVLLMLLTCNGYDEGYKHGRRDAECRAAFALAKTASDSLAVSRKDTRCADMLTPEAP